MSKPKQILTVRPEVRAVLQAAFADKTVALGDIDQDAYAKCVVKGWIRAEAVSAELEALALTDAGREVCKLLGIV